MNEYNVHFKDGSEIKFYAIKDIQLCDLKSGFVYTPNLYIDWESVAYAEKVVYSCDDCKHKGFCGFTDLVIEHGFDGIVLEDQIGGCEDWENDGGAN